MIRAIIMVGCENAGKLVKESYQLLFETGNEYFPFSYNEADGNRNDFYCEVSDEFADRIINTSLKLESKVCTLILNGHKIDTVSKEHKKIDRLDDSTVANFSKHLKASNIRSSRGKIAAIPAELMN